MTGLRGTVLERDGAVYRVATPDGVVRAVLRGKVKRDTPHVVVGDRVLLDSEAGSGEVYGIAGVEERRTLLERRTPEGRGTRPVAANIDRVYVVSATTRPDPIPQLIDRLLVVAEANHIPAAVVLNKIDLDPGEALAARFRKAGYEVFRTTVKSGEGIEALRERLLNHVSVVTGPSGAGKSSLLNAIQPGLTLRTGEISRKIGRGTHTTVSAVMIPLEGGGYLVDTPGFSEVGVWDVDPRHLDECFPDMRPFVGGCRYGDCRHMSEPGCAITQAAERGVIDTDRLESYRMLLAELEGQPKEWE